MRATKPQRAQRRRDRADDMPSLGPCCICERSGTTVRNMVMLTKRAPIAGRGWGCLQCHLPADGAFAVVCDLCLGPLNKYDQPVEIESRLRFACRGYPGLDGRIPIGELGPEHFDHDPAYHRDELDALVEGWLDEEDEDDFPSSIGVFPPVAERTCRVCGCTDRDCSGCVERTGQPCYWIAADLCSACRPAAPR